MEEGEEESARAEEETESIESARRLARRALYIAVCSLEHCSIDRCGG